MYLVFFILGYFLPFYPLNSRKNENVKKIKKLLEISSFYTSVPKIMIRYDVQFLRYVGQQEAGRKKWHID